MRAVAIAILLLTVGAPATGAEITTCGCPTYTLKGLVQQSDLIIEGRPFGPDEPARFVTVDRVVKGKSKHRTVPIVIERDGCDCSGIEGRDRPHKFYLKRGPDPGAPYRLLLAIPLA